jgi:hypothetical protein
MENVSTKAIYHKHKNALKNIVFTSPKEEESNLLKEENIKDLGN